MKAVCAVCGKPVKSVSAVLDGATVTHGACAMESAAKAHGRELPTSGFYGLCYTDSCAARDKAASED